MKKKMVAKNSQTYKNLLTAFSGESEARLRYTFFSSKAKKEGLIHISKVFTETSDNEKEHAEIWYKYLNNESIPTTSANLLTAINNEKYEWKTMYAEFAKIAKKEGYHEISKKFLEVAKIEKSHEERYIKIRQKLISGKTFKSDKQEAWICTNCGNIIYGKKPPNTCPVCSHEKGFYVPLTTKINE